MKTQLPIAGIKSAFTGWLVCRGVQPYSCWHPQSRLNLSDLHIQLLLIKVKLGDEIRSRAIYQQPRLTTLTFLATVRLSIKPIYGSSVYNSTTHTNLNCFSEWTFNEASSKVLMNQLLNHMVYLTHYVQTNGGLERVVKQASKEDKLSCYISSSQLHRCRLSIFLKT